MGDTSVGWIMLQYSQDMLFPPVPCLWDRPTTNSMLRHVSEARTWQLASLRRRLPRLHWLAAYF